MTDFGQVRDQDEVLRRIGQTEVKEVPLANINVRAFNSANISINNATATALTYDSERYDTDGMHSTAANTGRLTCTRAGRHHLETNVAYASGAGNLRWTRLRLNGATDIASMTTAPVGGGNQTHHALGTDYNLAVGDYVETVVYQDSGGALNVAFVANYSPEFSAHRIS